jgi:hypothetical protein
MGAGRMTACEQQGQRSMGSGVCSEGGVVTSNTRVASTVVGTGVGINIVLYSRIAPNSL